MSLFSYNKSKKKIQINNFGLGWHYQYNVEHRAVLKEQYNTQ